MKTCQLVHKLVFRLTWSEHTQANSSLPTHLVLCGYCLYGDSLYGYCLYGYCLYDYTLYVCKAARLCKLTLEGINHPWMAIWSDGLHSGECLCQAICAKQSCSKLYNPYQRDLVDQARAWLVGGTDLVGSQATKGNTSSSETRQGKTENSIRYPN